jgi:hypothetical protein
VKCAKLALVIFPTNYAIAAEVTLTNNMDIIERVTVPAGQGYDPITAIFEDYLVGGGRITLICYDMAWTGYYGSPGSRGIKEFFVDCGADYLSGNIGSGRQYKQDKQSQAYLLRIIKAAQAFIKKEN